MLGRGRTGQPSELQAEASEQPSSPDAYSKTGAVSRRGSAAMPFITMKPPAASRRGSTAAAVPMDPDITDEVCTSLASRASLQIVCWTDQHTSPHKPKAQGGLLVPAEKACGHCLCMGKCSCATCSLSEALSSFVGIQLEQTHRWTLHELTPMQAGACSPEHWMYSCCDMIVGARNAETA